MSSLLRLHGGRAVPYIAQDEAGECGLACLAMVAGYHGLKTDMPTLRRHHESSSRGATLKHLVGVAEKLGLTPRALRLELDELEHLALPTILHWELSHFVVLARIRNRSGRTIYEINDPARGVVSIGREEISRCFTGVALELSQAASFQPRQELASLSVSRLWSSISGFWPTVSNVLIFSVIIQAAALFAPFYTQIAIDTVLPSADNNLLIVLAGGFLMLAIVSLAATWIRSLVITALNNSLSYQIVVNLFGHLMRLPLSWMEKRHVGDVVSRFGSTGPVTQLLSQGMVAGFVDGAMAIVTAVVMMVYSLKLAAISFGAFLVYAAIRAAFMHSLRLLNTDAITTAARENSIFIESVRGFQSIKAFGQEGNRQRFWQSAKADAVNAQVRLGRQAGIFDAFADFVPAAERVVFVYVAIGLVMMGDMSLGMVFAYQAYKQQFLDAGMRLVQQVINYRVMHVHLARVADIALAPTETNTTVEGFLEPDFSKPLLIRDLRFRYSPTDPDILRGVTFAIRPGEMLAMIGPSGGGKTTLLKLLSGLLEPSSGSIALGEANASTFDRSTWRRSIGMVSQGDTLFAGTLAENISFFDPEIDMARVERVARDACIHNEIAAMPLGYHTLVGDMGSTLSGGQKQRILLARALYPQPKILFLDEGTAHLDDKTEEGVVEMLKSLEITRIVVAHRPRCIEAADRTFVVANGMVMPQHASVVGATTNLAPLLSPAGGSE